MEGLESYLAMGGYGHFVWPAFGLTAVIMVWLLVATLRQLRARQRLLAQLEASAGERRPRRARRREEATS